MTKRTVILDVDTGHDDAVAIMMAGRSRTLRLDAITVTAGNQTLAKTLRNTLNVCSALSLKVPVYPGMRGPLLRPLEPAPLIHGESGLDGPKFPECTLESRKEHAAVFLARRIMKAPAGTITVVATGPLSNIAMALLLEPSIAKRMRELVIMGGAVGWGNITPAAEYNSYADPEAARIVYASGASITLIPLDVTRTVTLTKERLAHLSRIPGKAAELFTASMTCYSAACAKYIGESASMHDPCCIAWLEKPDLFTTEKKFVSVETEGTLTRGTTVVDHTGVLKKDPNARIALTIDAQRFWDLLEAALQRYQMLA